ncbi:MAG: putative Mg2+ transporter-C (MgtC) family protein [Frankiaceae bacterium]|nr:putative Mg2+ transporter-C (MgtC) family protein [Frankiaceae bacterium]
MLSHDLLLWSRLLLASGLCFALGYERELRGHDAGDRTFALVGLGAAAFTLAGIDALGNPDRIVQGITTGIGFIGGGLVLQSGAKVRGLTTAAALWTAAAIGVLSGAGRLVLATLTMLTVLLLLEVQHIPPLRFLDARRTLKARLAKDEMRRTGEAEF